MSRGVLVHEWLEPTGGAERVFDAMVESFPDADILCLWSDREDPYPGRNVSDTWLARSPLRHNKALALPSMMPTWRFRRGAYEWALVSSHLFAHHVRFRSAPTDFRKFVYAHSPARYIWEPEIDHRGQALPVRVAAPLLRALDRSAARDSFSIAANSAFVKERIARTWRQDSRVIYPPVDVARLTAGAPWNERLNPSESRIYDDLPKSFILGASRFVPYKMLEGTIAAGEAAGLPVVIAGSGPHEPVLRQVAAQVRVPVRFVINPSDALLYSMMQRAMCFAFLAVEDFGIVPVEAMALGTPVVCLDRGGVAESVLHNQTGVHVPDLKNSRELCEAVHKAADLDAGDCTLRAAGFGRDRFIKELQDWISE